MSYTYNRSTLIGRLTKDPEIKEMGESQTLSKFTVAVDRRYKKDDQEQETDFIPVVAWGKLAKLSEELLHKGSPVLIDGRIQVRSYEKEDARHWRTEVVADNFQLLSLKPKSEDN